MIDDPFLRLGKARYDRDIGQLQTDSGAAIPLSPQATAVLVALVVREGQDVSKQDLTGTGRPGTVETDEQLIDAIAEIRRALGEQAHALLRPVSGVGYKLTATPQQKEKRRGNTLKYLGLAVAVAPIIFLIAAIGGG